MPVSNEGTWFENPRVLLDDYIDRLRSVKSLDTLQDNPITGADSRYVSDMASILKELKNKYETEGVIASFDQAKRLELTDLFNKRQQYLKSLGGESVLPYSERLQNWGRDSGLDIKNLNVQDFGGLQHETVSHHVPWLAGFSPDYTTKSILNYKIAPSPASPLNEAFAGAMDRAILVGAPINLRKELLEDPEGRLSRFYGQQGQYAAAMSDVGRPSYSSRELETDPGADTRSARMDDYISASVRSNPFASSAGREYAIFTPGQAISPENADLALKLDEASKLIDWKLVKPLRERYENLGRVQAPESISRDFIPDWAAERRPSVLSGVGGRDWREMRSLPLNETNFNRMLNLGQTLNFYGEGDVRKFGGGYNMLFNTDPVTSAALGGAEVLRNLRRTPTALLPGAADLIPSPEAIRTGYSRGPVAMGKQMAQEFVQSLPTAAGAAMLLSAPAAAPFAPGIGAGMVGTAGARALNEVVRQETGEGIVPKVRQFIGTAPRTGVANRIASAPRPLTATIKPLTAAQKAEADRRANRNELQRRIDLANERRNLRRGELGLSELLFGR